MIAARTIWTVSALAFGAVMLAGASRAMAAPKGRGGNGNKPVDHPVTLTFRDDPSDRIFSDGNGPYVDGADGVSQAVIRDSGVLVFNINDMRSIGLDFSQPGEHPPQCGGSGEPVCNKNFVITNTGVSPGAAGMVWAVDDSGNTFSLLDMVPGDPATPPMRAMMKLGWNDDPRFSVRFQNERGVKGSESVDESIGLHSEFLQVTRESEYKWIIEAKEPSDVTPSPPLADGGDQGLLYSRTGGKKPGPFLDEGTYHLPFHLTVTDNLAPLATGGYLNGPYAALNPNGQQGDGQTSIVYNANTGELAVGAPAAVELTSINIDSAAGIFTGNPAQNLGGSFDNDADNNIFKATFGSSFGSLSFGNVAQAGLSEDFVLGDLTVIGSLAGGGDLGDVDLIYVPEPSNAVLVVIGLLGMLAYGWRQRKRDVAVEITTSACSLRRARAAMIVSALLLSIAGRASAAQFFGLGYLPGRDERSFAWRVSDDGSVVIGWSQSASGHEAFRWTADGMVGLGYLRDADEFTEASGVSADGSVVVGLSGYGPDNFGGSWEAFRWTSDGGMVGLGDLPGGNFYSSAVDVSHDGSVVVGWSRSRSGRREAFRWTEATGMVGLGSLPRLPFASQAWAVSADGSVVVGRSGRQGQKEAFRWTADGGMVGLGDLPGGEDFSLALDVSADGSVVVGQSDSALGAEPYRWTEATGMVGLGHLPGDGTIGAANGVSAKGSVVVGFSGWDGTIGGDSQAFIWDETHGMRNLQELLINVYGLADSLAEWTLSEARAVSDHGLTIVGYGTNPSGELEAWVADLGGEPRMQAGDADQDLDFNQLDLVQVQIAAKYLTGQPATWGEGDWNGAPGGSPGNPPAGDGLFNQLDIIAALAPGHYLTGPYSSLHPNGQQGDGQTSIVYNANTGELSVDAPAGTELTSINIDSAGGIFSGNPAQNLGGSFDNDADNNIFKATFGSSFGSLSFGNVAQAGLSEDFVLGDLTVIGSLAGGGDLGDVDLIYVPEPSTVALVAVGLLGVLACGWRQRTFLVAASPR